MWKSNTLQTLPELSVYWHQWRRGRDSNPRYLLGYARFPGVCLKPLSHLSIERKAHSEGVPQEKTTPKRKKHMNEPLLLKNSLTYHFFRTSADPPKACDSKPFTQTTELPSKPNPIAVPVERRPSKLTRGFNFGCHLNQKPQRLMRAIPLNAHRALGGCALRSWFLAVRRPSVLGCKSCKFWG